jgi:hypothetical protein
MFSIRCVLVPVNRTKHFAWCDRCLRGSFMYSFDAPLVARFFTIEALRACGWKHVVEGVAPRPGDRRSRADAERMWSSATYCPECAAQLMNAKRVRREPGDGTAGAAPARMPVS